MYDLKLIIVQMIMFLFIYCIVCFHYIIFIRVPPLQFMDSHYWEADVVIHFLIKCVMNQAGAPGVGGMVFWHNKMSWL